MADEDDLPDTTDPDTDDTAAATAAKPEPPAKPKVPGPRDSADDEKPPALDLQAEALKKANREASERRRELAELRRKLADMEAANATEAEKAVLKARQEAAAEAEARWRPQVVAMRADAALSAAGCADPDDRELLLAKVRTQDVELDESGNVVGGLADQVEALKGRYAKMFATARQPARTPSAREVDAGDKKPPAVKKSATQQQVDRLLGRG